MSDVTYLIDHRVRKVTSIDAFKHVSGSKAGKAILSKPYWIKINDGWCFDFIRENMDVDLLKHNIKSGAVYELVEVKESTQS